MRRILFYSWKVLIYLFSSTIKIWREKWSSWFWQFFPSKCNTQITKSKQTLRFDVKKVLNSIVNKVYWKLVKLVKSKHCNLAKKTKTSFFSSNRFAHTTKSKQTLHFDVKMFKKETPRKLVKIQARCISKHPTRPASLASECPLSTQQLCYKLRWSWS